MALNPKRLCLARKRRGLTQIELAKKTGVTARMIRAYEAGHSEPRKDVFAAICCSLGFPEEFFFLDDPVELSPVFSSFRSLRRMTAKQRDSALAAGSLAFELSKWIEERFVLPAPQIPDFGSMDDPEAAASALRIEWGLGSHPLPNLIHLLESRGVRSFSLVQDCTEVDAFSTWLDDRPFMFLNTKKSPEHGRYDAAHELGHLVMHQHADLGSKEVEDEANKFAACFLMPKSAILAEAANGCSQMHIIQAKKRWGVSAIAYAVRLFKLGLLTAWQYRQLCIRWRTREPFHQTERETSQILRKVFSQLRESGTPRNEVSRELSIPTDELNSLIFRLVLSAVDGNGSSGKSPENRRNFRIVR